ncbi:MAG: hypothetical protein MJK15_03390 [Colwellia sp.]|nr:hypothetical protein [Colwellia sp.]
MKTLSRLEKQKLAELYKILAPVKNSHEHNSDSINDFIFGQSEIRTGDELTSKTTRNHFEIENKAMLEAFDIVEMLVDHFDV